MKRREFLASSGALTAAALSSGAFAQTNWPDRPIKLIVPFAAGGPTDVPARLIASRLGERLGQSVVVENRLGAGGNIATEFVVRSPADGYTLLYHTSGLAVASAVYKNLRFDPRNDLVAVGMTVKIPAILVANPAVPSGSPKQFFDYLRANPGKLAYGSGGVGNGTHLGIERILQVTGTKAIHVAYKGTASAMVDLIGGQVQFMSDALNSALPYIRDGRIRPVALLSASRSPLLPDVPTLAESMVTGLDQSAWHGILAPARTPDAIIKKLNGELNAVLAEDTVKAQLERQSIDVRTSTPQEFSAFLASEIVRWTAIARAVNVTLT